MQILKTVFEAFDVTKTISSQNAWILLRKILLI